MSDQSTPLLQAGDVLDDGQAGAIELLARMLVILAAIDPNSYRRIEAIADGNLDVLAAGVDASRPSEALALAEAFAGITTADIEVQG